MAIKVYKEWKLSRGEDGKYLPEHKTLRKSHTVIDEWLAEQYNQNTFSSGLLYELDEEKTKELETDISKRMAEKIKKQTKVSFTPVEVKEPVKEPEKVPDKVSDKNQLKYDRRKAKMIETGWIFDADKKVFSKNNQIVDAEELLLLDNIKYGKLLK